MSTVSRAAPAAAVLVLCGCTGSLSVTDEHGGRMSGIPVVQYEPWVEDGLYTKLSKGGECAPAPYHKVVSLPTGAKYYVMPEGSMFAKTSFTIKLNADGALTDLTFNTESNLPETLNATTNLLKALPAIGLAGAKSPTTGDKVSCDAGEQPNKVMKLDTWLSEH